MPKRKRQLSHVTVGSVFDDRDLFTPEEGALLKIKSAFMDAIENEAQRRGYTQAQLGTALKEYQPNVSNLLRGKISKFSVDKLIRYATRLGLPVEVAIAKETGLAPKPIRRRNGRSAA